jgi:hypothetical protein
MIFRNLDDDGDWEFGNGKGNYLANADAIALNIKTRILSWVGDCFFNKNSGIDWINRLGSKNQLALLETDLRRIITQSAGVTSLENVAIVVSGRAYKATYTINSVYSKAYVDSVTIGA